MAAKANFNAYHNYAIDSLHQWDRNQVLTLRGLNLATAPEVHFSNKNMDRAIVRQASMVNHVVTVNIPNSLLQDPLRIYAHIGIYEGNAFTVVETVEIPVIPRTRPCDYQIEDTDGEIYSFSALENALQNKASNARVDNIIANASGTENNAELIDVRTGADETVYTSAGAAVREQFARALKSRANKVITSDNYLTELPDVNDANVNTVYNLLFASGIPADSLPAHIPIYTSYGALWLLLTVEGNPAGGYRTQLFINTGSGEIWTRYYGAAWSEWSSGLADLRGELSYYLRSPDAPIDSGNYMERLPDLNDAPINSAIRFLFSTGLSADKLPANIPFKTSRGTMWSLITLGSVPTATYSTQVFVSHGTGEMWTRLRGSEWGAWNKYGTSVYRMTASENLLEVLLAHQGDTIYVPAGEYDIIQIYKAYAGEAYFDTYEGYTSGGDNIGRGLPVYDGTALICSPAAKFTCHYTGANANVAAYFSAFATGDGFTIDGLQLETSGLRYAIHDDFNGSAAPYKSIIRNCHIRDARRAIGGGAGAQGIYEIVGNYFGNDAGSSDVAYHNNARAGRNHFTVMGNYFEHNLSLRHYGAATTPSACMVSGNSFGGGIEVRFENDEFTNENMALYEWNNTIRN